MIHQQMGEQLLLVVATTGAATAAQYDLKKIRIFQSAKQDSDAA